MTLKEFANKLADEAKKNPTNSTVRDIVNKILKATTVGGNRLNESQLKQLLDYLSEELGNHGLISETFDNKAAITLMQQITQLINQANEGKKNG